MNTSKSQRTWAVALCIALAAMGCAEVRQEAPPAPHTASTVAPQPLPSGTIGANLVTATARVKALDRQTRLVTMEELLPYRINAVSERCNPPHTGDCQAHASNFCIKMEALVPPNPKEFERTVRRAVRRASFATIFRSTR